MIEPAGATEPKAEPSEDTVRPLTTRTTPRLYLEELRNARSRQLAGRALRPINRRRTRSSPMPRAFHPVEGPGDLWRSPAFSDADKVAMRLPDGELELLGRSVTYPPRDWNGGG